jgi:hypothetical protein
MVISLTPEVQSRVSREPGSMVIVFTFSIFPLKEYATNQAEHWRLSVSESGVFRRISP